MAQGRVQNECLNPAITPDVDWPELSRDYSHSIYILNTRRYEDFSEGVCDFTISPKSNSLFGVEESPLQKSAIFGA